MRHLSGVAAASHTNLMTKSNLGVCFGPTLLRSEEESMASIMDIKFCNIVVEHCLEYLEDIFGNAAAAASAAAGPASPFPGTARPRPAGRSPVPARKDKKPAPTPPKRPPKFTPSIGGALPTPQITPNKTGSTPQVQQQQQQQQPSASKNPFDEEEEVCSPITDPSNPFYDEIPSTPTSANAATTVTTSAAPAAPAAHTKGKSPPPPTPPAKTRLYPKLPRPSEDEDDDIAVSVKAVDEAVSKIDDYDEPVFCVDRRFRTEATSGEESAADAAAKNGAEKSPAASSRSSLSSVEVEIPLPVHENDNDRNNNLHGSSNSNHGNDNNNQHGNDNNPDLTFGISNLTYASVVPVDAGDIDVNLADASADEDDDELYAKIGDEREVPPKAVITAEEFSQKAAPAAAYDDVAPHYAAVIKVKKTAVDQAKTEATDSATTSEVSTMTYAVLEKTDAAPAMTTNEVTPSISVAPPDTAETPVLRRDRPVASPRRRPLSQTRPPLPPLPTASSALDVSGATLHVLDDPIAGSNLSLDDGGLYESVTPRSSIDDTASGYATLSPQAPSRSRRSIQKLNTSMETVEAGAGGSSRDPKEPWVPTSQR